MWDAAKALEENASEVAKWESMAMGKPIRDALEDVESCVDTLRYFAGIFMFKS